MVHSSRVMMMAKLVDTLKSLRRVRPALLFLLAMCLWLPARSTALRAQTASLPNLTYAEDEVFQLVSRINGDDGAPRPHSSVVMHQGTMAMVYANEGAEPLAGIAFFDISDPANPRKVAGTEEGTGQLSEQHAMGFTMIGDRTYVALLAVGGIEFWDWSDIYRPVRLSHMTLPGVQVGYATGAWWLFWQAPYVYVSGASNGLYIVDATDPARPELVDRGGAPNPIPINQTGGFRLGSVFAVGNQLVLAANDGPGYATMDIADPRNPVLQAVYLEGSPPAYSSMVNGGYLYAAGTKDKLHIFDISDPTRIVLVGETRTGSRGGYLTVQDGFIHMGASEKYVKIDARDVTAPLVVGTASSGLAERDEDFAVVLGNLVAVSDDHGMGTFLFPHQAKPDTSAPRVTQVQPADNALNQARTSRVGLTFSDQIDLGSVNGSTLIVRPVGGDTVAGQFSGQTGIINFWPDEPLMPDTTYEILLPAGGIRDVVGNSLAATVRYTFATGRHINAPIHCEIVPVAAVAVGQPVDFQAQVTSTIGLTTHAWTFGDGSDGTIPLGTETTRHTYARPGHYIVRAAVGNDLFQTACATQVTVHEPIVPGRATSSSTIIFDADRARVWVVNPDHDSVTAINAVTHEVLFQRPVGRHPRTLAQASDGAIWVVNQLDATITILAPEDGAWLATVPLPPASAPYGIIMTPDRRHMLVTCQATGQLIRLEPVSRAVTGWVDVGPTPRGLAASPRDGHVFVARYLSPDTHGEVTRIDPTTLTVVEHLALAFDHTPDTENSGRGLPNGLGSPAVSPDGGRLWIPSNKDNMARGRQRDGLALTFDSTVRPIVSQIDLATGQEVADARIDFNDREGPVAVAFSPLGDYGFVLMQGSNAVVVVDSYSGRDLTAIEEVGMAPQGLVFTSDGTKLFVDSWLTRTVAVYNVKDIIYPGRDQTAELLDVVPLVDQEVLPGAVLRGKQIFYNANDRRINRDGYISCASCHLDGGHDARTWDRTAEGEGLRNTIDLRSIGHMLESGRLHWSANFDEIQDFEQDMRLLFGGSGFLADEVWAAGTIDQPLGASKAGLSSELDALAAFVAFQARVPDSPHRAPGGGLTEDGVAGQRLFQQLGCAVCHGGPTFSSSSNGLLHDLGTVQPSSGHRLNGPLRGIDAPSLLGVWQSPPYLHDGSAATLRDALLLSNGWHGDVAALTESELAQLISFLLQLDGQSPPSVSAPPSIVVAQPAAGARVRVGEPVTIAVNTSTGLGPVARILFFADGLLVGEDTTPIFSMRWTPATSGSHELTTQLIYANGAKSYSAPVTVIAE